jgi:hypothetical protein
MAEPKNHQCDLCHDVGDRFAHPKSRLCARSDLHRAGSPGPQLLEAGLDIMCNVDIMMTTGGALERRFNRMER